jgi:hypothetical protein
MNFGSILAIACICLTSAALPEKNCRENPLPTAEVRNKVILEHPFLATMYADSYFPKFLVDKGKEILLGLCMQIEEQAPKDLPALYRLTHAATVRFNELGDEFFENDSEIETRARECITQDFKFIAVTYGFDADIAQLTAPREW